MFYLHIFLKLAPKNTSSILIELKSILLKELMTISVLTNISKILLELKDQLFHNDG